MLRYEGEYGKRIGMQLWGFQNHRVMSRSKKEQRCRERNVIP